VDPRTEKNGLPQAVELRHELRKEFGTLVTLDPSDVYYMEDKAPPGPIYANPLTTTSPIYEEEALDALARIG
jgi:hypothetical protein